LQWKPGSLPDYERLESFFPSSYVSDSPLSERAGIAFTRQLVPRVLSALAEFLRHPRLREVVLWCAPALLVGLFLRVWLCLDMPYGHYHDDAPDFLTTPDRLIFQHTFELHQKKTFLVPILFTLPFALPAPALVTIPIAQHLLGLAMIVLIGALCRLWFTAWRVWIIPITVLAAVNPFYMWYEHTLMAESVTVFCMLLLAFMGTLYARNPSLRRFVGLCVSLVLLAGARPEGKLLFGFGIFLLLLVHWRELFGKSRKDEGTDGGDGRPPRAMWRERLFRWRRPAILVVLGIVTHFATQTSQAGLLLYTAMARLTPTQMSSAPGFEPYIAPIREDLQKRWDERPQFPRVRDRKAIGAAVDKYLKAQRSKVGTKRETDVNRFCLKLAKETCLKNLKALPSLVLVKFRLVATESPAGRFDDDVLFGKQRDAVTASVERTSRLSRGLVGVQLNDEEALRDWVDTHYQLVPWFNQLNDRWLKLVNKKHMRNKRYKNPDYPFMPIIYYGIPYYFIAGAIGMVVAMLRPGSTRAFHLSWGLALAGFFFVIMLTANVRPRFRFVFEPFWFIYIAMLLDTLWLGVWSGVKKLVRR
jgi:hypothetical protein